MRSLSHLMRLGTNPGESKKDIARVTAINLFGLAIACLLLFYAIFFIFRENYQGALVSFIATCICLIPPTLNSFKFTKAARFAYNTISAPTIYYYIYLVGPGFGVEYFLILTFSYPFIFLKKEEKFWMVFFFLYNSVFLFLSEYVPLGFITPLEIPQDFGQAIKFSVIAICCFHAGIFYYLYDQSIDSTEDELINAKNSAVEASNAKRDFLASMSHEIRTPLNTVVSISQLLSSGERHDQKELISSLQFSSKHLMNIINDILDFSKLEAGKILLNPDPVSLKRLIDKITRSYQVIAEEKGLSLMVEVDPEIHPFLLLDELRFTQILGNLINNALKFTHKGNVKVSVHKTHERMDAQDIMVTVSDTGIGIPAEKIETIFSSFSQLSSSVTKRYGGSGLGLNIVSELLKLYDSKIMVDSLPGKGSSFMFLLTLEKTDVLEEDIVVRDDFKLASEKILIVEDYEINAIVTKKTLMNWGLEVDIAKSGKEAISKFSESSYELVLMDIHMPDMDGVETTKRIRQLESYQGTPIYAFSADITAEDDRDFGSTFAGFLSKPLDHQKVKSIFSKHLKTISQN